MGDSTANGTHANAEYDYLIKFLALGGSREYDCIHGCITALPSCVAGWDAIGA
jgi:hypothetical protein